MLFIRCRKLLNNNGETIVIRIRINEEFWRIYSHDIANFFFLCIFMYFTVFILFSLTYIFDIYPSLFKVRIDFDNLGIRLQYSGFYALAENLKVQKYS